MFTFNRTIGTESVSRDVAAEITIDADGVTVTLDGQPLNEAGLRYVITYGLKQSLADSYASAKTPAEFDAFLSKRIERIIAGTITVRQNGASDPFEAECLRIATAQVIAIAAKAGVALPKRASDEFKALVARRRNGAASEAIEAEARRRLDEVAAIDIEEDVDLDALLDMA